MGIEIQVNDRQENQAHIDGHVRYYDITAYFTEAVVKSASNLVGMDGTDTWNAWFRVNDQPFRLMRTKYDSVIDRNEYIRYDLMSEKYPAFRCNVVSENASDSEMQQLVKLGRYFGQNYLYKIIPEFAVEYDRYMVEKNLREIDSI
jgi:hypothetical protein